MEKQQELCTSINVENPRNVPIESTGRTNTDTPIPISINASRGLRGVIALIDCMTTNNDQNAISTSERLTQLDDIVQKTFNKKVQHVVFCDNRDETTKGHGNTPLVSCKLYGRSCVLAKKLMDSVNYPLVDIKKYQTFQNQWIINYSPKYERISICLKDGILIVEIK